MDKVFKCIILLLIVYGCDDSSKSIDSDNELQIIKEFESQVRKDLKDDNVNGSISAAIVKDNKVIWSKAFGVSDNEQNIKADTNTIYRIASISKSFTAFLMMQLVEEGIIKLDDPIDLYLAEVSNLIGYSDTTRITFRQLASHTSGLAREPKTREFRSGVLAEWENKTLQAIPHTSFSSRPGQIYNYSNIGYGILGLALSRAAKKPFMELVKEKIFIPLDMNNSYFAIPNNKKAQLAKGMFGGILGELDKEKPEKEHEGRGYKVPNGGIYSTPSDLSKFMICNLGFTKNILSNEYLELMQRPQTPEGDWSDQYGFGFSIYDTNSMYLVNHDGNVYGYRAQFAFEKKSKYGVVMMRNYNWGSTNLQVSSYVLLRKLMELEYPIEG